MNFRNIKKFTFALTLAFGFAGSPGLSSLSTAQAQVQPNPQREQLRPVTMEERSAFREGYRRGWEDARSRRGFDYNRSRLYRMGDREYRDIFRKGYYRGYHRYGNR